MKNDTRSPEMNDIEIIHKRIDELKKVVEELSKQFISQLEDIREEIKEAITYYG